MTDATANAAPQEFDGVDLAEDLLAQITDAVDVEAGLFDIRESDARGPQAMTLADRLALARTGRRAEEPRARLSTTGHLATTRGHRLRTSPVDPLGKLKRIVHQTLQDSFGPKLYDSRLTKSELEKRVRQSLHEVLATREMPLEAAEQERVIRTITDEIFDYGPVDPYLHDVEVAEIMVNGPDQIYVERAGKIYPVDGRFNGEPHLRRSIDNIVGRAGRRVEENGPMVDARLPDGSRVNAIVVSAPEIERSVLTIRKYWDSPFTIDDLIFFGTLPLAVAEFLDSCVRGRLNIVISGGIGAGKTTTLNALSSFIPNEEHVVTIENAAELQLHQEHVLRLETHPSNIEGRGEVRTRDLIRNALRMRPDRIVVGEIYDAAALDMLHAFNAGHDGWMSTVHENNPREVISRIEMMVLMAGADLPLRAVRDMVASGIDLIVHQSRFKDGSRRITQITEVVGMEGDIITLQDIFVYDHQAVDEQGRPAGGLHPTGLRPRFMNRLAENGVRVDPRIFNSDEKS